MPISIRENVSSGKIHALRSARLWPIYGKIATIEMVTSLPIKKRRFPSLTETLSAIIPMKMRGRPTNRRRPDFGARLARIRAEQGITQLGLARKLRVNRSLIRYYERDTDDPKLSFVVRCAKALDIPPEALIGTVIGSRSTLEPKLAHFIKRLTALDARRRALAVRLFSRQLVEFNRTAHD